MLEEARREEQLGLATKPCSLSGKPTVAGRNSGEAAKAQTRKTPEDVRCWRFPKQTSRVMWSVPRLSFLGVKDSRTREVAEIMQSC